MHFIVFTHPAQLEYLQKIFRDHIQAGIPPENLALAADTFQVLSEPREIPLTPGPQHVGDATLTEIGPNNVAFEVEG